MELDDFTLYVPCKSLPSDIIHPLLTLWLNGTPYRHTPAVKHVSKK